MTTKNKKNNKKNNKVEEESTENKKNNKNKNSKKNNKAEEECKENKKNNKKKIIKKKNQVEECKEEEEEVFSNVPNEVTTNIFSRLPVKSIGRGRCVCKLWYNILSDPYFINTKFTPQLSDIPPDIILFKCSQTVTKVFYIEDNEKSLMKKPIKPFKDFDYDFLSNSFHTSPIIFGCCNGFICLPGHNNNDRESIPIYVLNPLTEEYYELPCCEDLDEDGSGLGVGGENCWSGFGFESSKKEYKLVLITFKVNERDSEILESRLLVHTLGSTIWRRRDGVAPDELFEALNTVAVFVHGCLHWMADDRIDCPPFIVSFNLGVEEFDFVPSPDSNLLLAQHDHHSLGVLEGNLCQVELTDEGLVHIWVMKKYNVKESWVKQFSVQQNLLCPRGSTFDDVEILTLSEGGALVLLTDAKNLVHYDVRSRKCKFLEVQGVHKDVPKKGKESAHYFLAHPFVGNLISLKSAFGVECITGREIY